MTAINPQAVRGPVTAVPVVAGKGVRLREDVENNRVVAEVDETVLWEGEIKFGDAAAVLSESGSNFERICIHMKYGQNFVFDTRSDMAIIMGLNDSGNYPKVMTCVFGLSGTSFSYTRNRCWDGLATYQNVNDPVSRVVRVVGINRVSA